MGRGTIKARSRLSNKIMRWYPGRRSVVRGQGAFRSQQWKCTFNNRAQSTENKYRARSLRTHISSPYLRQAVSAIRGDYLLSLTRHCRTLYCRNIVTTLLRCCVPRYLCSSCSRPSLNKARAMQFTWCLLCSFFHPKTSFAADT